MNQHEEEYAVIERPLTMHQQLLFGSVVYDPEFDKLKNDWSYIPKLRLWVCKTSRFSITHASAMESRIPQICASDLVFFVST